MVGSIANPSEVSCRSPLASFNEMLACWNPMLVMRYLPSGVSAVPSCSVGPNVICSGVPFGYRWRHTWKAPPAFDEKYIHRPSPDQVTVVHWPSSGPMERPADDPSNGTRRHGSQSPFISTTSTCFRSGDGAERCAMPPSNRGKQIG